jgi:hypothetical protein
LKAGKLFSSVGKLIDEEKPEEEKEKTECV